MGKSPIDRDTLLHLAKLARIDLDPKEEEKLLKDLREIEAYISALQGVDTDGIEPMNGGTLLSNVFRKDNESSNTHQGKGRGDFPEEDHDYLKVSSVFNR